MGDYQIEVPTREGEALIYQKTLSRGSFIAAEYMVVIWFFDHHQGFVLSPVLARIFIYNSQLNICLHLVYLPFLVVFTPLIGVVLFHHSTGDNKMTTHISTLNIADASLDVVNVKSFSCTYETPDLPVGFPGYFSLSAYLLSVGESDYVEHKLEFLNSANSAWTCSTSAYYLNGEINDPESHAVTANNLVVHAGDLIKISFNYSGGHVDTTTSKRVYDYFVTFTVTPKGATDAGVVHRHLYPFAQPLQRARIATTLDTDPSTILHSNGIIIRDISIYGLDRNDSPVPHEDFKLKIANGDGTVINDNPHEGMALLQYRPTA